MRNASPVLALLAGALLLSATAGAAPPAVSEYLVSPPGAHFPQNKHNESPMAVNPVDPLNAISGANDETEEPDCTPATGGSSNCPFDLHTNVTGVYVTQDGGATWSQQILHWNDYGLISDGDPVVAFGPKPDGQGGWTYANGARAYFASLAGSWTFGYSQELIAVAYSDDNGLTWSAPVIATNKDNPVSFNDKLAIWADSNPASPYFGSVYVSWTLFKGSIGVAEPIMFTRSTDGGLSFCPAKKLTPSADNKNNGRQGSLVKTAPDGTVYVIWDGAMNHRSAILAARSTDGGSTFTKPFLVTYKNDLADPLPGTSFRTDTFPMADVDTQGNLYVTWTDYVNGHASVKLARSYDRGATWTVSTAGDVAGRSAFYPAIAVQGGKVFIGFNALDDRPAGTAPGAGVALYDAYYLLSADGGNSFGAPVRISAASSDPDASSANSLTEQFIGDYNGAAAGSDGTFWFSWTDARNGQPCATVDAWRAAGTPSGSKPNIYDSCSPAFGATDIRVAKVTP